MNVFFFAVCFFVWSCMAYYPINEASKSNNDSGDLYWGMFAVWVVGLVALGFGFKAL